MGINQTKNLHGISEFDKQHIPTLDGQLPIQKQDLPPPSPAITTKEEFFKLPMYKDIDTYILAAPSKLLVGSFDDVIKFFKFRDYWNDMALTRAIFLWVVHQDIYSLKSTDEPPPNSPLEYFISMQTSQGGYAHLIWGLCHMLGVPCVIINGMTKSAAYEVGGKVNRENMGAQWNAIYLKGEWRFIDAFWASACVVGKKSKDWKLVDNEGNYVDEDEEDDGAYQHVENEVNEFYFMTDPQKFIWTHYPDEEEWQCLQNPISVTEFEEHVYLRERFYSMEISLLDDFQFKEIIVPEGGELGLRFGFPAEKTENYEFRYAMYRNKSDEEFRHHLRLDRFVLLEHTKGLLKLSMRFPLSGKFKLDLYGMDEKENGSFDLICSHMIQITVPKSNCLPLPDQPAIGWGPVQETKDSGVVPKSHDGAVIVTEDGKVDIKLGTNKKMEIHQLLKSINLDEATLSKYVLVREENGEHFIHIRLPQGGEYALKIYANEEGMPGDADNILNYLISCSNDEVQNKPFPNVPDGMLGKKAVSENIGVNARIQKGRFKTKDGRIRLEFSAMSYVELMVEIHTTDIEAMKYLKSYRQTIEDRWAFDIDLPVKGEYSINVFARENPKRNRVYNVHSYLVFSDGHAYRDTKEEFRPTKTLTETIQTADNEALIPIPRGYLDVVCCLQRLHANDPPDSSQIEVIDHDNDKLFLTELNDYGEYMMNLYDKDEFGLLTCIARYQLNRKTTTELMQDDPMVIMDRIKEEAEEDEDRAETKSETKDRMKTGATLDMVRKRRHILMLKRRAMELGDRDALEQLIIAYEDTKPADDDPTLMSARKLLRLLNAKDELAAASRTRHLEKLKRAIRHAKEANYDGILNLQLVTAERLRDKLARIEKLRHNILVMDQTTAAELRTYTHPPEGVRQSIMAVLVLLEYPKKDVKDWKTCQMILSRTGKESIMRRVAMFDPKYCFLDVALEAKRIIAPFSLEEIRDVSNGAAAFYNWAYGMIVEVEQTGGASRPMDEWMRVTEDVRNVEHTISRGPASAQTSRSRLTNYKTPEKLERYNTQDTINKTYTVRSRNS